LATIHKQIKAKSFTHRNLITRTSLFALVLQSNFWEKHLVKNWMISPKTRKLTSKEHIFSGVYKNSLPYTKQGGDQLKKVSLYFRHASSSAAPTISMVLPTQHVPR
jgi:hypothetical protein